MKKSFTLSIPKPCSEKWDTFLLTGHDGFCSSCNKVVVDLTKKSDDEILNFFIDKSAHTCARFRPDQLKVYASTLPHSRINPGLTLLKAGFMSLLFLLLNKQASAQNIMAKAKTEVVQYPVYTTEENTTSNTEQIIRGVVRSGDDHMPMPGVNVLLKGSAEGTATDAEGRFELHGNFKAGDVIAFAFIGYKIEEYVIRKDADEVIEIELALDIVTMGEVAVRGLYVPEPSGFRKVWSKVKGIF